ncbi:hypothetical protein MPH_07108 [Macrophomina phaseolina MS6]|uniref:Uncharacterized protein n=2 Tax=Macrophomina phaseolina TaxID=35725 RepID=K2RLU9_MACPH|nr:hypothetical protein MPH_07108 [Macrophomina phaseolina MS6]KAH7036340.1 hypothetical protein B0J12DRAFT_271158 [Macrophomina phaseolina]
MAVSNADASGSVQPKSSHLSDPSLLPFIQPQFDPADHLNSVLPSLSFNSSQPRPANAAAVPLSELSAQTQALLSQLNAQTTRLSTVLTQMTDDILRSGSRLAYEVEVLRGETIGLSEALTESLRTDVEKFVPGGVKVTSAEGQADAVERRASAATAEDDSKPGAADADAQQDAPELPEYITRLRTLAHVRARLESVIKVFGEAMQWTLPPSEVSLASSLISVSAPEPGSDSHSREEKGREFAEKLRNEISELVTGTNEGYEAAQARIQALRDLSQVWKDTAEEKARTRFVDGLVKLAEERNRQFNAQNQRQPKPAAPPKREGSRTRAPERGNGFLDNLQRMRENIYLS